MGEMNEKKMESMENLVQTNAEKYWDKYADQMHLLEDSQLGKLKTLSAFDFYAVGKMLEQWEFVNQNALHEAGSTNTLGVLPKIAYDVITVSYGSSILPLIASVQPIEEERGIVYFENIKFSTTKGSHTAGDVQVNPKTGAVTPQAYASNSVASEVVATSVNSTLGYTFTLAQKPIRKQTLKITFSSTIWAQDDAKGNLLGIGLSGSVNYVTGVVTVNFSSNPGAGTSILADYQINYELASTLPQIEPFMDSTDVMARIYVLKGLVGMFQSFGMKKRFGLAAEEELGKRLVQSINAEIGGDAVRKLVAMAVGNTTWDSTKAANISEWEHRQGMSLYLSELENVLVGNAGRGAISVYVGGRDFCTKISALNGFTKIADPAALGPQVYGTYNGITVIRVNDANIMAASEAVGLYKGTSPWEAPVVYAPYMPLITTDMMPEGTNPLASQRAAASWVALKELVPNFVTKFTVTASSA